MISKYRKTYNNKFTEETYLSFLDKVNQLYPDEPDFRFAETPVFITDDILKKMLHTCEVIIDLILDKDFNSLTQKTIPENFIFSDNEDKPQMMVFDFGICEDAEGNIVPQLIEMQGFPSVFALQIMTDDFFKQLDLIPEGVDSYLNGFDREKYLQLLKDIIIAGENPEEVVLLELYPEKQKTKIDFYCTEKLLGIKTVCLTKLIAEDDKLFYYSEGKKIRIKRIFNRIIFDDLSQHQIPESTISLYKEYEVKWIPHPNWYYRISKFLLPYIQSELVPETFFLNEIKQPLPLDEYVLKPLFSYAGRGVITDVQNNDLENIEHPENYIFQKKVKYAPIIETPDEPAKCEIRLFYFWHEKWERPIAVHNLARLSKGKMIGTRYNQDKNWVGSSIAYFEKLKTH